MVVVVWVWAVSSRMADSMMTAVHVYSPTYVYNGWMVTRRTLGPLQPREERLGQRPRVVEVRQQLLSSHVVLRCVDCK